MMEQTRFPAKRTNMNRTGSKTKDSYGRSAVGYDLFVEPLAATIRQAVIDLHPPKQGMSVLDVGCGTGTTLQQYQEAGCQIWGIDLSKAMLRQARKKLGDDSQLYHGDASQMPYPDASFDLVLGMLSFHEMHSSVRGQIMAEMVRVMKPEGRILIAEYHPGSLRFPSGWIFKTIISLYETAAGQEHFKNYRDFLARKGIPNLIATHEITTEKSKIIYGGNIVIYLLGK